ncbi:hypothetical protein Pyn_04923 [Prunus yedoensis var. nudiflora]|uniref:Uncharacterized protein n=1 Tax=Prunus yedoensis var. nudiflora TaxID=2094558 RepID=A0A314YI61_PRUYE|nr:hypothetical protein Pyn_04923 [Prunus yedoensis var. nudiflora]
MELNMKLLLLTNYFKELNMVCFLIWRGWHIRDFSNGVAKHDVLISLLPVMS